MKKGGRTILIFLILIVVILISGVSISLFMLQKETQTRQQSELEVQDLTTRSTKLDAALKEARKQIETMEAKNKDAEDRINSLLEEIDLEKGLNEKIKVDNKKIREDLEAEARSKQELREQLAKQIEEISVKLKEAQDKAVDHESVVSGLQQKIIDLQKSNAEFEKKVKELTESTAARQVRSEIIPATSKATEDKVNLDRIVITPETAKEGHVLNIDLETEFLIFDLGGKNGIKQGDVMSVYRGKTYLGDVRVSRVQEEMAAADFIPPFSSRKVRKNDQVVPKR
jgi:peptidoglycan hydrolase CwlO-like protein